MSDKNEMTKEERVKWYELLAQEGRAEGWVRPPKREDGKVGMPIITIATSKHDPMSWQGRMFRFLTKLFGISVPSGNWVPMYFDDDEGNPEANLLCRIQEGDDLRRFCLGQGVYPQTFTVVEELLRRNAKTQERIDTIQYESADLRDGSPDNMLMRSVAFSELVALIHGGYRDARYNQYPWAPTELQGFFPGSKDDITMSFDPTHPEKVVFTFHYIKEEEPTLAEALASVPDPIPQYEPDPVELAARAIAEDNARTMGTDRD